MTLGQGTVGHAWQRRQSVFVPGPGRPVPPRDGEDGLPYGKLAVPLIRDGVVAGIVQLLGPEQPRIDGQPETIETVVAQMIPVRGPQAE